MHPAVAKSRNSREPLEGDAAFSPNRGERNGNSLRPETRDLRWKRILDLAILTCTVWIWLPVTLLVMCVVKLSSSGPAIYRQRRVGYRGEQFMIFKFRTMYVNAETRTHEEYLDQLMVNDVPMTKLDAMDKRLAPCGRFLRAVGLDELPQIFNVIRGEMSLVGPRPCTVIEFRRYRPEQRGRVNALPGITGYWQVNGKNRTTFNEMIAMDLFYANNMSLWLDLAIIWQTIPSILTQTLASSTPAQDEPCKAVFEPIGAARSNYERSSQNV